MKTILRLNFFLLIVPVSVFGQDISTAFTRDGLGLAPSHSADFPFSLTPAHTNQKLDSIAAHNMLWKPFDLSTVAVQAVSGAALAASAVALGLSTLPKHPHENYLGDFAGYFFATTLGSVALPTGIVIGGELMGGNGEWLSTIEGCAVGAGLGSLPVIAGTHYPNAFLVFGGILLLSGGIVGYNLSASPLYEANGTVGFSSPPNPYVEGRLRSLSSSIYQQSFQIRVLSIHL
jgi:hypothetical protein